VTQGGSTASGEPGKGYDSRQLHRSVISIPLLERIALALASDPSELIDVVIDVNLHYAGGRSAAMARASRLVREAIDEAGDGTIPQGEPAHRAASGYLAASLQPGVIRDLVARDRGIGSIFHVWPDFKARALLDKSLATVKADAAQASFSASGREIVWAVLDTGVNVSHPHFRKFRNTDVQRLEHRDFTGTAGEATDPNGHGTHVAGVIAGYQRAKSRSHLGAVRYERDETGDVSLRPESMLREISGIAPECHILSYKVLDDNGVGRTSDIMAALHAIQEVNDTGRIMKIHGVNLSLGYDFDPEWFACGQSPLCVEVDRLVRSGVVVVVAAGNTGYAHATDALRKTSVAAGRALTINDPGNAELAITVGSTHREMPHVYGVSYFSSKGPTGDGRAKPDLLAPGERILSATSGRMRADAEAAQNGEAQPVFYAESSGTSMAAPHVSGVIAAFLSIRREFIGRPERIKKIFIDTATDLGRVRDFQGHGLVDLMRAIQSV
jgi:serine protease AprX